MENIEENSEKIGRIWKIWKKGKLNSKMLWKLCKKNKLNCEMIWKTEKKIVKRYGKYGRMASRIVK
jgi:hypothetical protein